MDESSSRERRRRKPVPRREVLRGGLGIVGAVAIGGYLGRSTGLSEARTAASSGGGPGRLSPSVPLAPDREGEEEETFGLPSAAALEMARDYNFSVGGFNLMVMYDGEVILEEYAPSDGPDAKHFLASATKGTVGVAAVAAAEDGYFALDEPACESIAEWKDDPLKSKITFRHLLTMTSGLKTVQADSWMEIVDAPMLTEPGEKFDYGSAPNAFGEAFQRRLGDETVEAYIQRRILDPLGIGITWRGNFADGHPQLAGGAFMTARDWITFGKFVWQEGQWEGERIISRESLAECFKGTTANPAYGFYWWLKKDVPAELIESVGPMERHVGEIIRTPWVPEDFVMAAGAYEQRLYIIPSRKLVVSRNAPTSAALKYRDVQFLSRLLREEPA